MARLAKRRQIGTDPISCTHAVCATWSNPRMRGHMDIAFKRGVDVYVKDGVVHTVPQPHLEAYRVCQACGHTKLVCDSVSVEVAEGGALIVVEALEDEPK